MNGPEETELGKDPMPIIETDRKCIEHYFKQDIKGYERVGYVNLRNVILCEHGKKEEVRRKIMRDLDNTILQAPIGGFDARKKS